MAIENETEKSEPTSSRDAVEAAFDAYEKAGPDAGLITLEKSEEPADAAAADKAALGGEEPAHEVADDESVERGRDPRTGQFKKGDKGAKAPVVQAKGGHESVTQPEPVRANIVHNLMKMYGVSVESLAKVIDGSPVAQETAPSGPQQTFDPRFDEFYRQYQYDQQA